MVCASGILRKMQNVSEMSAYAFLNRYIAIFELYNIMHSNNLEGYIVYLIMGSSLYN